MLQPSSISLLAGFEFLMQVPTCAPTEWAGPISSGGSVPASLGFLCFVFTSNTLVLAVEREKKIYLFLMPQKPHELTLFWRATHFRGKIQSYFFPTSSKAIRF